MGSSNRISAVDNPNFGDSRNVENWPDLGSGAQARYGRTPQDDDAFAQDDHTVAVLAKANIIQVVVVALDLLVVQDETQAMLLVV